MRLHKYQLALALGAVAALTAPQARAALVISEVVFNEVGSDVTGEWVEIFNTGPAAIDLSNYKIGDEETSGGTGTGEAMHQFPAGATIAPGAVQIVAVSATTFFTHYGILPTYEVNSTNPLVPDMSVYAAWDPDGVALNMANASDHILILDGSDALVDAASWGNTFAFDPGLGTAADGQSWERKNVFVDTNTADDWQLGPNPAGSTAVQRSTPGVARVPEPASLALAFVAGGLALALRRKK
jgi:hypothetical protein